MKSYFEIMAYNAIICKYGMMILVWEVLRLSMNRTCWLLGVSIEDTHTPSKLHYELDFIKIVMTVEDDCYIETMEFHEIRANYRLVWKKNFSCTTVSPFTFTYNHKISNFPPFLTNLWKKDFFSLLPGFEPRPPGWQSTILANRPGSHDMYKCQLSKNMF